MTKKTAANRPARMALKEDVTRRVWYAFTSGDYANPYESDDKRHLLFLRELARTRAIDADFEDMSKVMGTDTGLLTKRAHPHPGPVLLIDELV